MGDARRRPFGLAGSNPVAFLKLFQNKILSRMTLATGLLSFGDYANIYDINNLYFRGVMDYQPAQVGNYAMSYGLTQVIGGKVGQLQIKHFGQKTHTLLSNIALAASMTVFGTARSAKQIALALVLITFSHQRQA